MDTGGEAVVGTAPWGTGTAVASPKVGILNSSLRGHEELGAHGLRGSASGSVHSGSLATSTACEWSMHTNSIAQPTVPVSTVLSADIIKTQVALSPSCKPSHLSGDRCTHARKGSDADNNTVPMLPPSYQSNSPSMCPAVRVNCSRGCDSATSSVCRPQKEKLLRPLAEIHDPDDAFVAREQNRSALIAELKRRKACLQLQLQQLKCDVAAQNIFALVRASKASELQHLLQKKLLDVNQRDYNGRTPLHVAAIEGNQTVISVLTSFGADIMALDNTGKTPLDLAAENRHGSVCRYLVRMTRHLQERQERLQQSDAALLEMTPNFTYAETAPRREFRDSICLGTDATLETVGQPSKSSPNPSILLTSLPPNVAAHYLASDSKDDVTCAVGDTDQVDSTTGSRGEGLDGEAEEVDQINPSGQDFSSYSSVFDSVSLVVCMVGLPGRGKSFIGRRITRYLNWKGVPCRVFNAGNYRRRFLGAENTMRAEFYDPQNSEGKRMREAMVRLASADLVKFIVRHTCAVGIFDATNTTKERRRYLWEYFSTEMKKHKVKCRILFIESMCNDTNIITENILRAKCGNDDFKHVADTNEVIAAFNSRISEYEKVYEPVDVDEGISFIRIVDVKQHVVLHKVPCGLASRVAFFLLNLHPVAYPIYIALPGETFGNRNHVYGGDERLTPLGEQFAEALKRFILERYLPHMIVLHGTNPSVVNTLRPLEQALESEGTVISELKNDNLFGGAAVPACELLCPLRGLDNINSGCLCGKAIETAHGKYAKLYRYLCTNSIAGGVTYAEEGATAAVLGQDAADQGNAMLEKAGVQASVDVPPHAYGRRHSVRANERPIRRLFYVSDGIDPSMLYCVQFPHGESCRQVNVRLEPALMAVMRVQGPVFVVASPIPAQGALAFFNDVLPEMTPALRLPQHAVVEIGVKGDVTVHQLLPPTTV
ncbi:6-phosphofructo-2-kinase/fructose-2,6-biphosphatase [Trypanosoma vivax]|nr:6-phosphofructo-2-kinase/fructose-2,6-biphosphatase [Trypanosoma vivax]